MNITGKLLGKRVNKASQWGIFKWLFSKIFLTTPSFQHQIQVRMDCILIKKRKTLKFPWTRVFFAKSPKSIFENLQESNRRLKILKTWNLGWSTSGNWSGNLHWMVVLLCLESWSQMRSWTCAFSIECIRDSEIVIGICQQLEKKSLRNRKCCSSCPPELSYNFLRLHSDGARRWFAVDFCPYASQEKPLTK